MRLLMKLMVLFVVGFVAVGFWQGWFTLASSPAGDANGNKVNVGLSIDKDKMRSDVNKAEQKVQQEIKELEGKAKAKETK
jgi:hypothetical protein